MRQADQQPRSDKDREGGGEIGNRRSRARRDFDDALFAAERRPKRFPSRNRLEVRTIAGQADDIRIIGKVLSSLAEKAGPSIYFRAL